MAMKKKKAPGRKVARRKKGGAIVGGMSPAELATATAGAGSSKVGHEELALPFIGLLQALSPQVNKRDDAYVESAEPGMFIETVSGAIWDGDEGLMIIPCHFSRHIIEWVKRKKGGGFVGVHSSDMAQAMANCQDLKNHDLVDTHQQAVLVRLPDGTWTEAIYPMKSTALTPSRRWNSNIRTMKCEIDGETFPRLGDGPLARWWSIWKITSAERSNDKGTFFVPQTPDRQVDLIDMGKEGAEIIGRAKAFQELCDAGAAQVDWRRMDGDETEDEGDAGSPGF